jgi:glycine cleavage system aminomethyltransferase T
LMDAGRRYEIRPIAPCEARRIEAGIFNYGSDMRLPNNPFEVTGLERLVEDQEADYVGKGALERIQAEGVSRKLVGVEMADQPLERELSEFWPAHRNGERVGHVTDMIWSPRLERNIGYVWVPIELAEPGTELEVAPPGSPPRPARTSSLPFLDPKKAIPAS